MKLKVRTEIRRHHVASFTYSDVAKLLASDCVPNDYSDPVDMTLRGVKVKVEDYDEVAAEIKWMEIEYEYE